MGGSVECSTVMARAAVSASATRAAGAMACLVAFRARRSVSSMSRTPPILPELAPGADGYGAQMTGAGHRVLGQILKRCGFSARRLDGPAVVVQRGEKLDVRRIGPPKLQTHLVYDPQ